MRIRRLEAQEELEKQTTKVDDENTIDYSALSHDELVAKINALQKQIDSLTKPPQNDWHSGFIPF